MARLIFDNLTEADALELAKWYEGQGEQEADQWFGCQDGSPHAPFTDVGRPVTEHQIEPYGGWIEKIGDDIIVHLRPTGNEEN